MTSDQLQHPSVVAILLLTAFIYYQLIRDILLLQAGRFNHRDTRSWYGSMKLLIPMLPLLGLLGTISGLLDTFTALSLGQTLDQSALLTSGISTALVSTQTGLLCALPAWLLLALLTYLQRREAA